MRCGRAVGQLVSKSGVAAPADAKVWLMFPRELQGLDPGLIFRQVLHFLSPSMLSRTRNAVILRIRGRGSGFSSGNWIEPLAVANFERSFANAFTADDVG